MPQSNENLRFCPSCGERHEALAAFCPSCGREVNNTTFSKNDSKASGFDLEQKPSRKRKALLSTGIAFVAVVLVGGGVFFLGGGEGSEIFAVETVADCVVDGGYLALADSTSSLIEEMGSSLSDATAIGTREALLRASDGLNTVYGPAFSSKAEEWRDIDDCGDQKLASFTDDLAFELSVVGNTFTSLEPDDTAALVGVTGNMNNITAISNDLAAYIGSL